MSKSKGLAIPLYWLLPLAGLAAVIVYAEIRMSKPEIAELLPIDGLTNTQSTALGYATDLSKLMISWCMGILAAIAVSARAVLGWDGVNKLVFGSVLMISFCACILSIWLGTMITDMVVRLLTLEQNPLKNDVLQSSRRWQYLTFVVALVFFVFSWLSVALLTERQSEEKAGENSKRDTL